MKLQPVECSLALGLMLVSPLLGAATLEVSPTGCNDSSCDPCCTISAAVILSSAGGVINVRSGTYVESVDISSMAALPGDLTIVAADGVGTATVAGTSGSAFTTSAQHSGHVTLSGFNVSSGLSVAVKLGTSGGVSLSNITVLSAPAAGGIEIFTEGNFTLSNCAANATGGLGVFAYAVGNAQVTGCTANGNAGSGIQVMGDTVDLKSSSASDNSDDGIWAASMTGDVTMTSCSASGNGPSSMAPADGLELHSYSGTVTVRSSVSSNNERDGLRIDLVDSKKRLGSIDIERCQFASNGGYGILVVSEPLKATDNLLIGDRISCTDIAGNTTGGLSVPYFPSITAELCWWNHSTGPSGIGTGSGDAIDVHPTNWVDYEPWLTAPFADSPECALFKDGFETGDTSAWSNSTEPSQASITTSKAQ